MIKLKTTLPDNWMISTWQLLPIIKSKVACSSAQKSVKSLHQLCPIKQPDCLTSFLPLSAKVGLKETPLTGKIKSGFQFVLCFPLTQVEKIETVNYLSFDRFLSLFNKCDYLRIFSPSCGKSLGLLKFKFSIRSSFNLTYSVR